MNAWRSRCLGKSWPWCSVEKHAEPGECDAKCVKYAFMPWRLASLNRKDGKEGRIPKPLSRWVTWSALNFLGQKESREYSTNYSSPFIHPPKHSPPPTHTSGFPARTKGRLETPYLHYLNSPILRVILLSPLWEKKSYVSSHCPNIFVGVDTLM